MGKYLYVKMTGCVKGEKIKFVFTGLQKMNVAVLSEQKFVQYEDDLKSVVRHVCSSNAIATIESDGVWYAVLDNNGAELQNISGTIYRYSPLLSNEEIWNNSAPQGCAWVLNAKDTDADGSMIQYWKDHQHKDSKINLNNKTYVCPSCGKRIDTDCLHGAHVVKVSGGSNLYITPTCDSCNTSKINRVFKVESIDLIVASK